jgi:hypothetical protein
MTEREVIVPVLLEIYQKFKEKKKFKGNKNYKK